MHALIYDGFTFLNLQLFNVKELVSFNEPCGYKVQYTQKRFYMTLFRKYFSCVGYTELMDFGRC